MRNGSVENCAGDSGLEWVIVGGHVRPMYRFHVPLAITQPLAKEMYWELMNMVRGRPYMPRFEVSQYVKMRY